VRGARFRSDSQRFSLLPWFTRRVKAIILDPALGSRFAVRGALFRSDFQRFSQLPWFTHWSYHSTHLATEQKSLLKTWWRFLNSHTVTTGVYGAKTSKHPSSAPP
jgi:hypothetical protein